ncbi:MAG: hypothetical protein CSB48_12350 [Proteobacteria bacterium]|nr:MAG: hypothetical protein CSB48_12350 [Pseudomonadota bacterium]
MLNASQDITQQSLTPRHWYFSSPNGDSAIRIRNGLKVGESADGTLTFNDITPDHQWVEFRLDNNGGLSVNIVNDQCHLKVTSGLKQTVNLIPGTLIALPHNRFYVSDSLFGLEQTNLIVRLVRYTIVPKSPDSQPAAPTAKSAASNRPRQVRTHQISGSAPEKTIRKKATIGRPTNRLSKATPRTTARFGEIAGKKISSAPPLKHSNRRKQDSKVNMISSTPVLKRSGRGKQDSKINLIASANVSRKTAYRNVKKNTASSFRGFLRKLLAGALATFAIIATVFFFVVTIISYDPAPTPAPAPVTATDSQKLADTLASLQGLAISKANRSDAQAATPLLPNKLVTLPSSSVYEDSRFSYAIKRIHANEIITPPGKSAVAYLGSLLEDYPDNQLAKSLLEICAQLLTEKAAAAHARGIEHEARNMLEKALALAPDNQHARSRWVEWYGSQPD